MFQTFATTRTIGLQTLCTFTHLATKTGMNFAAKIPEFIPKSIE